MNYIELMFAHLWTVVPAFFIGTALLFMKKGTNIHKIGGRVFMVLMLITAIITLFMPAHVGPQFLSHFGFIHLFSLLTLQSVPKAYFAIKRGDVKTHRSAMIGLYIGGLLIAGGFTFFPGRYLHTVFWGG